MTNKELLLFIMYTSEALRWRRQRPRTSWRPRQRGPDADGTVVPAQAAFTKAVLDHLPRERIVIAAPESCPCCGLAKLSKLGEDITETLEVIPRQWKARYQKLQGTKTEISLGVKAKHQSLVSVHPYQNGRNKPSTLPVTDT